MAGPSREVVRGRLKRCGAPWSGWTLLPSYPLASPLLASLTCPHCPTHPLNPPAEFMRDTYGGVLADLSARTEERRRAEAAAAAQQAEMARLQAQAAEQRLASAEGEAVQLRARLADAERRLGEVQAELARERSTAAAAAAQLARLEQQVQHLAQSKEAEGRSLSQQADAQLRAAQAAHQAEAAQLGAARAAAEHAAADAQTALAAAQAEVAQLRQATAASGAAAQDVQARLAAAAAEREGLSSTVQVRWIEGVERADWIMRATRSLLAEVPALSTISRFPAALCPCRCWRLRRQSCSGARRRRSASWQSCSSACRWVGGWG